MRIVIVTGMSGAGKTTALKMLEDMGFYCVDNLPIRLIEKFVELIKGGGTEANDIALGIDIRNPEFIGLMSEVITQLKQEEIDCKVLFLEASDECLIKRYKETRRSHPLSQGQRVEVGIAKERKLMAELLSKSDYVINTSQLLTRELKAQLEDILLKGFDYKNLFVTVLSFGFKYGIPTDADLVFDVRFLPNPYYFENMRLLQLFQNTVRRIVGDISVIDCHLQHLMKHRVYRINCGCLYIPFIDQMIVEPLHVFPDGLRPHWESLSWLQKRFMKWFNRERTRTVLTFPVETMALLTRDGDVMDSEWGDFTAQMYAEGHSFFTYMSDNADSLSSCCRLRNEIQDNGFSYTLGAGGVSTGSKSVLTINLNRCIQYAVKNGMHYLTYLEEITDLVHKVQTAYNENLKELKSKGMLPLFDAGYINLSRQYLTTGVTGLVEAAEFLGIHIDDNDDYVAFVQNVLGLIERYNKKYRTKELMFNCEMIPAENVGVKHAKWDREDGYAVPRDCYNSYFYVVEDQSLNVVDKFRLHGRRYIDHLTGGSALHMNLEEHLSKEQYRHLLRVAAAEGCNYFTFNIPNTVCNKCGHIDKRYLKACPACHSDDLDYLTRVIGYMKRVSNFSAARQQEAERRYYGNMKPAAGGAKTPGQQGAHPQEGPHPQREPFAQKESAGQKSSPAQEAV